MNNAIEVRQLVKQYPDFILDHVDFTVKKGSIVGLVGENGAGKTTLIKCILNAINKDSGSIQVFGQDHITMEKQIKQEIGVVLDNAFFPDALHVDAIEKIMANFYATWDHSLFMKYLKDFELPKNKAIRQFSKGMKMKLAIICALCHHPKLLILDEPTSGLDPIVRSEILDLFRDFIQDEEHSILISSHITSDLEHIADYITFIDKGKIVLSEAYDVLSNSYGILRCDDVIFNQMDKSDILRFKRNKYSYDVLVNDMEKMAHKFPKAVIDHSDIEEIMLLFVKGEKA